MNSKLLRLWLCFAILVFIVVVASNLLYLPAAVPPQEFLVGDELKVKASKLTSAETNLHYPYYSLCYCRPDKRVVDSAKNLWDVLRGDRVENSPYLFQMRVAQMCKILCRIVIDAKAAEKFNEMIENDYRVNMLLNNIPLVQPFYLEEGNSTIYPHGFPVGVKSESTLQFERKRYFIYNHLAFTIKYCKDSQTDAATIVAFEVTPGSIKHEHKDGWGNGELSLASCDADGKRIGKEGPQEVKDGEEIIFTYDVEFLEINVNSLSG